MAALSSPEMKISIHDDETIHIVTTTSFMTQEATFKLGEEFTREFQKVKMKQSEEMLQNDKSQIPQWKVLRNRVKTAFEGLPESTTLHCSEKKTNLNQDTCIASWEDGKLKIDQKPLEDGVKPQVVHRELDGEELVQTMYIGDVVCKRFFRCIG